MSLLDCSNCSQVNCHQQSSPSLWSLRLMRILLSSLSHVRVEEDQSQRWRVEEDSNHMTSQIIVDPSRNTVYDNTLRVRGREGGLYVCNMSNNRHEYIEGASTTGPRATERVDSELNMANNEMSFTQISYQKPSSLNATYKTPTSISLEWTFNVALSFDYSYVVYYQSRDGVSHSVAFTTDSREDHTHNLTGLPVGKIHSISVRSTQSSSGTCQSW